MIAFLALLLAVQPGAFERRERTEWLDFRYSWPAEAEAIPALRAELGRRLAAALADAQASARETRDSSRDAHLPFYQEQYHKDWSIDARNARVLALSADNRTDQNGAHPNRDFDALIWDRAQGRARSAASLLGPAVLARLQPIYCSHLASQIAVRGGEPPAHCPPLADRVLSFLDQDHDGRFETLHVLIPPYVAASYADGSFVVDVLFNRGDLRGMAEADREGFEETPGR
jgi:hypothetical protein